ncbi:MAG TPA: G8 domain-containing protein, partial [Lacipirellulaceae bacterium]|nr:G8 domain-containing protein [Lacipirellulaceae bacterium]
QALDVRNVRLSLLTSQQTSWLTIPQIQSLQLHDFKHLHFAQIPWLSSEQVASIPDHGPLAEWSSLARAALTQWQIPSLNIASLGINWLTSRQIEWLTPTQLAQVRWLDFNLLTPGQIRHLTPDQFASVTDGVILRSFRDELQIQFSRAQLLALPERVLAELMRTLTPPTNYTPTVEIPIGPDGIGQSHHLRMEAERVFDLAPIAAASHVAVSDGDWTDPRTWRNGVVPGAGARVLIPANLSVRFNAVLAPSQAITTLRIDGTLYFARNVATQMYVDTILVNTSGKLHIGTPGAPIASEASARIFITGGGPINAVWDPYLLSRGLISRGEVRMAGREVTPYASLSIAPRKGDTQLVFSQTPVDWRAGDVITLMGTQQHVYGNYSEQLVIRSITGNVVTVDALRYDHLPPEGFGLSVYAVNHSRNIQFAAVDASNPAHRPHMMFLHNPNVVIENISVTGFGRTDKTQPINDPVVVNGALQAGTGTNVRGRYAMHFHHTGVNPAGGVAYVRGSIIEDSPGWGFVNHSSHVVMEYNVTVGVLGAGFVTEDGNEIGVMRGNMALTSLGSGHHIQSRQYNHDFGHGGHGFWLQGPGVSLVDNIAAGHAGGAFVIFTASSVNLFDAVNLDAPSLAAGQLAVPVGTVPFKQISGNVAMTSGNGLEVWFHQTMMPTGRTLIDRFTAWNIRNEGISLHYVGPTTIRNATLVGNMNSFRGTGIAANHITHNILYENVHIEGFEKGIVAPPRRYNRISSAVINATYGIYVEGAHDTLRTLDIAIGIIFRTATPEQLRYQPQFRVYMSGRVDLKFRSLESILAADRIRLVRNFSILSVYYFPEQSSEYVPFTAANTNGYVPDSYLGLTNQQLRQRFGVSLAGEFPAYDAISVLGYRAWVDITPGR